MLMAAMHATHTDRCCQQWIST